MGTQQSYWSQFEREHVAEFGLRKLMAGLDRLGWEIVLRPSVAVPTLKDPLAGAVRIPLSARLSASIRPNRRGLLGGSALLDGMRCPVACPLPHPLSRACKPSSRKGFGS